MKQKYRLHTSNKKHVYKERKETTHVEVSDKEHTSIYKEDTQD